MRFPVHRHRSQASSSNLPNSAAKTKNRAADSFGRHPSQSPPKVPPKCLPYCFGIPFSYLSFHIYFYSFEKPDPGFLKRAHYRVKPLGQPSLAD
jgi:hypothetical protein